MYNLPCLVSYVNVFQKSMYFLYDITSINVIWKYFTVLLLQTMYIILQLFGIIYDVFKVCLAPKIVSQYILWLPKSLYEVKSTQRINIYRLSHCTRLLDVITLNVILATHTYIHIIIVLFKLNVAFVRNHSL